MRMDRPDPKANGAPGPARAATVALLVALLLFLFTGAARYAGGPGEVGYGWATTAAAAALAACALGIRRGWGACAYGASGVLALLIAVWGWGLIRRFDLGRGIWVAICIIALREVWPGGGAGLLRRLRG